MDPAFAVGDAAEKLGVVFAAGAAAASLLLAEPRRRAVALGLAAVVAAIVLLGHIWSTPQFRSISGNAPLFVVLMIAGLAVVGALAVLFLRHPDLLPLLALAVLPFRVPVQAAGTTSNLLVPLYVVIAGATAAYVVKRVRFAQDEPKRRPGLLQLALATFIGLYALQSLYSDDFDTALEQMVFFYIPFTVLFTLLAEVRWTPALLVRCLGVVLVLALVFSVIGFWEYHRRELFWNPKVISANQFQSYFRVNSVFWDPNIYGRFLALVMVSVAAAMLWSERRRISIAAAVVLAVLWGGLVLTFSQSSFASLLVGLAVIAALRWNARRVGALAVVGLAAATVFVVAFQTTLRIHLGSSSGLNDVTSGRTDLIRGGVRLFRDRPLWGYGSGSFARTYRVKQKGNQRQAVSASHTLPITVAAEQGLLGLAVYAFLLAAAARLLLMRAPEERPEARAPPAWATPDGFARASDRHVYATARVVLVATFAALVAHTMVYASFLEDPLTWVILGTGLAIAPLAEVAFDRAKDARSAIRPAPVTAAREA
jgi:O-antigen ligase